MLGYIEQEIEHRTLCTEHLSITSDHLYWCIHLTHALAHIMVHILMDIMVHILVHLNWCIPWCIPYVSNGLVSNGLVSKRILHNVSLRLSFSAVRPCLKRMFIDFLRFSLIHFISRNWRTMRCTFCCIVIAHSDALGSF